MVPIFGNAIQFLSKFPESNFQKQVSTTPCTLSPNSMFVQKKGKIGAFYKQGSGLAHSLVQENPEKDNSEVSCSLGCAKYPPPLQSKTEPLAPLSCRSARSVGEPLRAEGSPVPMFWLPLLPSLPQHPPGLSFPSWEPLLQTVSHGRALSSSWGAWCCSKCGPQLLLSGSHSQSLPSGFHSMQDEVSHPPALELGCPKVVSDLSVSSG